MGYTDFGTHWITLHVSDDDTIYFDSFRVEHVPKEVKKNLLEIKTCKQIYLEYKEIIQ